jgi:hypothetical protein
MKRPRQLGPRDHVFKLNIQLAHSSPIHPLFIILEIRSALVKLQDVNPGFSTYQHRHPGLRVLLSRWNPNYRISLVHKSSLKER